MIKKLCLMSLTIASLSVHAGWVDSDWTEPGIGCIGGALLGYSTAQGNSGMQNAALYCAVGSVGGVILNKYYENKIGKQYTTDVKLLQQQLKAYQVRQATDAALGIDSNLAIRREVIPGAKRSDGTVTAPTIQYELDQAGSGMILGD
jgi:outer membrane lipoprotein SlyB